MHLPNLVVHHTGTPYQTLHHSGHSHTSTYLTFLLSALSRSPEYKANRGRDERTKGVRTLVPGIWCLRVFLGFVVFPDKRSTDLPAIYMSGHLVIDDHYNRTTTLCYPSFGTTVSSQTTSPGGDPSWDFQLQAGNGGYDFRRQVVTILYEGQGSDCRDPPLRTGDPRDAGPDKGEPNSSQT